MKPAACRKKRFREQAAPPAARADWRAGALLRRVRPSPPTHAHVDFLKAGETNAKWLFQTLTMVQHLYYSLFAVQTVFGETFRLGCTKLGCGARYGELAGQLCVAAAGELRAFDAADGPRTRKGRGRWTLA